MYDAVLRAVTRPMQPLGGLDGVPVLLFKGGVGSDVNGANVVEGCSEGVDLG
jgi:hypothetical protein